MKNKLKRIKEKVEFILSNVVGKSILINMLIGMYMTFVSITTEDETKSAIYFVGTVISMSTAFMFNLIITFHDDAQDDRINIIKQNVNIQKLILDLEKKLDSKRIK